MKKIIIIGTLLVASMTTLAKDNGNENNKKAQGKKIERKMEREKKAQMKERKELFKKMSETEKAELKKDSEALRNKQKELKTLLEAKTPDMKKAENINTEIFRMRMDMKAETISLKEKYGIGKK